MTQLQSPLKITQQPWILDLNILLQHPLIALELCYTILSSQAVSRKNKWSRITCVYIYPVPCSSPKPGPQLLCWANTGHSISPVVPRLIRLGTLWKLSSRCWRLHTFQLLFPSCVDSRTITSPSRRPFRWIQTLRNMTHGNMTIIKTQTVCVCVRGADQRLKNHPSCQPPTDKLFQPYNLDEYLLMSAICLHN